MSGSHCYMYYSWWYIEMGFQDPTEGHGISGGGMQAEAPPPGGRQLNAPKDMKPDTTPVGIGIKKLSPPDKNAPANPGEAFGRTVGGAVGGVAARGVGAAIGGLNNHFGAGSAEARPAQEMPGGMFGATGQADDTTEDV